MTPAPATRRDLGDLLPQQGRGEAHPSGPLPRVGRAPRAAAPAPGPAAGAPGGHAPETSPLDLAAIALAAARDRRAGLPPTGSSPTGRSASAPVARTVADDPTTGGTPRPAYPAAVPSALAPPTPSHAVPAVGRGRPGRRVPLPTRTAGALALVGALAGGGVAVIGGGSMLAADPTPETGELRVAEAGAAAATVAPASRETSTGSGDRDDNRAGSRADQGSGDREGGRHRADRSSDGDS
ncbi:hypothetical protein [Actinomycetospora cinnamomea]|uniref:hypothetical protein n=1 Tax=Actinomycetospora cinnamomea TaxID=663609 RepID=UPI000E31405C|nr:hypothetical protein [Actinomycetospora cinnamomea]